MEINTTVLECIAHKGIVSVVSWTPEGAHVANTWNSYVRVYDNQICIPAFGFRETEKNIAINPEVKLTLGSSEVQGKMGMGTGFLIEGTARFISDGPIYDEMKEAFSFLNRVLIVTVKSAKQTV